MHTPPLYLERKQREIALLKRSLRDPWPFRAPRSAVEAVEQKLKLAAALRARQSLQSWAITETARPATRRWQSGAFAFSYGYQRADLAVRGPPIYPWLPATRRTTIYTSSGMSAIAALAVALTGARDAVDVTIPPDAYAETRELLDSFGARVRRLSADVKRRRAGAAGPLRVLWVDSCVRGAPLDEAAGALVEFDLVVFDTTCFWRGSRRVRRIADLARKHGLPLVLVRSHTKLDCLGIEYGRLGSIVVSTDGASADRLRALGPLARRLRDAVRLYGAGPIPAHFPPFASGSMFERCSRARTASIIRHTRRLSDRLRGVLGDAIDITCYRHGAYLTFAPGPAAPADDVRTAAAELAGALAAQGLPVAHAGSFGFDFVAIEWFPDARSGHNVIRVAGADLPLSTADRVAERIAAWWTSRCPIRKPRRRRNSVDEGGRMRVAA